MAKVYVRVIHDLYGILRQFPSPSTSPPYHSMHKFFIPKPILPPNAAFQKIVGPMSYSSNLATHPVALDACKKLHQLGASSEHLLPFHEHSQETNESTTGADNSSFTWTTKRKELHGMERVRALHGTWAESDGATLNKYRIHFVCNQEKDSYSDFVLLLNSSLDEDIASAEIKLFLTPNKIITSSISPCGKIYLSAEQVEKSKLFQEFFFNGMFGKLFTESKASGFKREFLLGGHRMPWSSSKMYLLLPLEPSSGVGDHTGCSIEWKAIYESISVVEYLKKIYSVDDESGNATTSSSPVACETICVNSQIIKLANKCLHVRHLKDSVVFSIHDGKIYSVLDVINDVKSDDPFDQIHATQFVSFTDHYRQKYGIVLRYPQQPLLLLKQSHNPDNLLSRSRFEGDSSGKKIVEKEQVHAYMPPELLVHINVSTDIFKSFCLLPSIMHRLESLMLACQLRDEIAFDQIRIPISLILEAITTPRCCESFSLERLELLGDSVLEYALSCHLFLKHPTNHKRYLSDCKSQAVRNSTLHTLGTNRSLQSYILDNAFDPLRWLAPGQISIDPLPCVCGVVPCDKGHRWMCSKTIADCVEALVGAYYAGGGLTAALSLIRWLGIDIAIDKVSVAKAKISASHLIHHPKVNKIKSLESKLSYVFSFKGLLLEAITHASCKQLGLGYCYQRLEFLGDSVLDLLITWHLFLTHKDVGPGVLTVLRSASVSNENFAQIATRNNFDKHLQHRSGIPSAKIKPNGPPKAPKVLGDMVESIAGAILIDTDLNLDAVWKIFKPLLFTKRKKGASISTANSLQLTANVFYPKTNCISTKAKLDSPDLPITVPIRMEKGGPRIGLFNLCKTLQCPMPHFQLKDEKFRTPIILNGVRTPNLNLFRAIVSLHIPNSKVIIVQGEERTDKKTAKDSAAREVLLELEKQDFCILKEL